MDKNRQLMRISGFLLLPFCLLMIMLGMGSRILTAQAAETAYVQKKMEYIALIHLMDDGGGEIGNMKESWLMTSDGDDIYCMDFYEEFITGPKTLSDISAKYEYSEIEDLALHVEYLRLHGDDYGLKDKQNYMMRQLLVWRRLSELGRLDGGKSMADGYFLDVEIQNQIFEAADQFYEENKGKYICGGSVLEGEGQITAMFWATPKPGAAALKKVSANESLTQENGCYTFKGGVYTVYADKDCTSSLGDLTLKTDGTSNELELPEGTYYIKESVSPTGYLSNPDVYTLEVKKAETATLTVQDTPGFALPLFAVKKIDAETDHSVPQGGASLAGARFEICYYDGYYEKDALPKTPLRSWVLQTLEEEADDGSDLFQAAFTEEHKVAGDEFYRDNGQIVLPLGTVSVREIQAPEGYLLNEDFYFVTRITMENDEVVLTDELTYPVAENLLRGGVKVQKRDLETGEDHPQGSASLAGAVFEILNENPRPVLVEGTLYEPGEVVLKLMADESGSVESSADVLPYGSYLIREVNVPEGYLLSGTLEREFQIQEQGVLVDLTAADAGILDQVIRGDLEGVKVAEKTQERLANVPFKLTSVTTGESHVLVTDENGQFSTAASFTPHTQNTNRGTSSEDGIWFGGGTPDDTKGALPYDTYWVEEQACAANEKFDLIPPFQIKISKDQAIVHLGTLTDSVPEIAEKTGEKQKTPVLTSGGSSAPRTGDSAALLFWGIFSLLSLTVLGTCAARFICGRIRRK